MCVGVMGIVVSCSGSSIMASNIFASFSFSSSSSSPSSPAVVPNKNQVHKEASPYGHGLPISPPHQHLEPSTLIPALDIEDAVPPTLSPPKKKKGKSLLHMAPAAPPNWRVVVDEIRMMRADRDAPVDLMGTHQLADAAADKQTQRFHLLVAAMISSQTRDSVTAAAMKRLHSIPGGLTVNNVLDRELSVDLLAEILKPVGFYRQKAKYLKGIAEKLAGPPHFGCVPCKLDELVKLPGVGPKVALLVLWVAFGKGEEGLIVDTNVRRVCCRLGWTPEGSNPDQVRMLLEEWLPKNLWPEISFLFVGFGQQVCRPMTPACGACKVSKLCPAAFNCVGMKSEKRK